MFPWNYGFHWNTGTIIFMGALYTVVAIVAATVLTAVFRSWRALRARRAETIRWNSDFHDLTAADQQCRHVLTNEFSYRQCPNSFDCRKCETHKRLMAKEPAQLENREEEIFGMSFPLDRAYHRGHTWLRREPDGTVAVGMDDLGRRILGAPDTVEMPQPGERVYVNGTAWRFRKRSAAVRVLSPVDGEVVATGGPGRDFYLKVKPDVFDTRHLLCGREIKPWLMRELERLQLALSAQGAEVPTLADGGVPVEDIAASYPNADWDAVCGQMFLHP